MRLTDSAIDRVWIFAGANQCVNHISASMDVTVCPARCLGPIMEPSSTNGRADLASIISHAGQARLTETSLRLRVSLNRSSVAIPARGIRGVASVSRIGRVGQGSCPSLKPARRRPMSTQGGLAYSPYASEDFLCAHFRRSDGSFSIRIPAAECMIGRDRVVNSRDLHTAIAPGAGRASGLPIMQQVLQMPKGSTVEPDRCPASEFRQHAIC